MNSGLPKLPNQSPDLKPQFYGALLLGTEWVGSQESGVWSQELKLKVISKKPIANSIYLDIEAD